MLFYRMDIMRRKADATEVLKNSFSGTHKQTCVILGAGAVSNHKQIAFTIRKLGIPVFACNMAGREQDGSWWLKPNFWTYFDPTVRFPGYVLNDPTIMKFARAGKDRDIVPETDGYKLCDSPNLYFVDSELRDFSNYIEDSKTHINTSGDTMIQAIDIAYQLGFRRLVMVGCPLKIRPSQPQIDYALSIGVKYADGLVHRIKKPIQKSDAGVKSDLLKDFVDEVADLGFAREPLLQPANAAELKATKDHLSQLDRENQYHFGEVKSLDSAIRTDLHYFDRVQQLRMSRKCFNEIGLELYVLNDEGNTSRLTPWFESVDVGDLEEWSRPYRAGGRLIGLYSGKHHSHDHLPYHRDVEPYHWDTNANNPKLKEARESIAIKSAIVPEVNIKQVVDAVPEVIDGLE
jgi:hypothetical protein